MKERIHNFVKNLYENNNSPILNFVIDVYNTYNKRNKITFRHYNRQHKAVISAKLAKYTVKSKKCKECKYYLICDGLWKRYAQIYGYSELKPSVGKKIKEPYAFMISNKH